MRQLYPFQRQDVEFLQVAGSALVGNEMGTGKTPTVVVTLEEAGAYPALVVCPNSVKRGWAREFGRWAPHRKVVVAESGTAAVERQVAAMEAGEGDVLIINWEALPKLSRLAKYGSTRLQPCKRCDPLSSRSPATCEREDKALNRIAWQVVVADEVHRAKSPTAKQTRALWAVGDRAQRRIAMTGTPVANSPEDLWSIMRFVAPDEWAVKTVWVDRYCIKQSNYFSGGWDIVGLKPEMKPELESYFLPRFVRHLKSEVLPDLPPKVYESRDVKMGAKQQKAYDEMKRNMVAAIQGGILVETGALTAAMRLRQLANAYGELVVPMTDEATPLDSAVRLTEPSSKLDALEEVLEELGPRQAVIFAESSQLIDLAYNRLMSAGLPACSITGDTPMDVREQNLEAFRQGLAQYMLLTMGAGGEGLDGLQVADTAIFLQRSFSAILNNQAEDRLHRIGQTGKSVTYIDLIARGTIEDHVEKVTKDKKAMAEQVIGK